MTAFDKQTRPGSLPEVPQDILWSAGSGSNLAGTPSGEQNDDGDEIAAPDEAEDEQTGFSEGEELPENGDESDLFTEDPDPDEVDLDEDDPAYNDPEDDSEQDDEEQDS